MATLCIPREIKEGEGRVILTPEDIAEIYKHAHKIYVEQDAGRASGFSNADYHAAGAKISSPGAIWRENAIVAKVKELQDFEFHLVKPETVLFLFAHLKGNKTQQLFFEAAETRHIQAIPYEDIRDRSGRKPILREMSIIAGKLAAYIGCEHMRQDHGGPGLLPQDLKVQILGAGNAGMCAYHVLRILGVKTIYQHDRYPKPGCFNDEPHTIADIAKKVNVVICAAFDPLFGAPKLVSYTMAQNMKRSALIIDIAIDEGGNCDFSKPTIPAEPIYTLPNGVRVYALPNLPGMVPRSSSPCLSKAVLPYILAALELKKARRRISLESVIKKTMQ